MAFPVKQKSWIISANNRIPCLSASQVTVDYVFGVKSFLKSNGYTVIGSSDGVNAGTAGTPDGVDRWVSASDAATRGGGGTDPQSWVILRDGNGVDILIAVQGYSSFSATIRVSTRQLFVVQAVTTRTPVASDQITILAGGDMVGSQADGDRVWHGWVDSDSKMCRFVTYRNGYRVGMTWGVEEISPTLTGGIVSLSPPVWAFSMDTYMNIGGQNGYCSPTLGATPTLATMIMGCETANGMVPTDPGFMKIKPELQGSTGYAAYGITLFNYQTAGAQGKYGDLIDWWLSGNEDSLATGILYGTASGRLAAAMSISPQYLKIIWPWDSSSSFMTR